MQLHLDVFPKGHAFVNAEEPLGEPCIVVRDDRRSNMGRDLDDNLVLITNSRLLSPGEATSIDPHQLPDVGTNLDNLLKVTPDVAIKAYPVNVDGLDVTCLFGLPTIKQADDIKAFTCVNFDWRDIEAAVDFRNQSLGHNHDMEQSSSVESAHEPTLGIAKP